MNFLELYKGLIKKGYRPVFIREKIAKHCGVSIHTVARWCDGKTVRDCYLKLLESFEI